MAEASKLATDQAMMLPRRVGRFCCRGAICRTVLPTLMFCIVISLLMNLGDVTTWDGYEFEGSDTGQVTSSPFDVNPNPNADSDKGSILDQIRNLPPPQHPSQNRTASRFTEPSVDLHMLDALSRVKSQPLLGPKDYVITGTLPSNKRFITIGIPTVFRQHAGNNYLKGTIASLLENCNQQDRQRIIIFVFLADLDIDKRLTMKSYIRREYSEHLASGLIVIFEVRREAYPPLQGLKQNFKDEPRRVTWRSKQVCDFAFMFYVARNLSQYYVQIEDDVVAAKDYVPKMDTFIKSIKKPWVTLLVSELGFIGKVYNSKTLEPLARFLIMFYSEMPVDFLYIQFAKLLTYPDMPLLKPTLFQHMGEYSSLILSKKQKINNLKDKYFGPKKQSADNQLGEFPKPQKEGNNPPAALHTSLAPYQQHSPENAYQGAAGTFFWGKTPQKNDHYTVVFNQPQKVEKVAVETGHFFQRNDFLRKGVLEVSSSLKKVVVDPKKPECEQYQELGQFNDGRVEVDHISKNVTSPLVCLRIRVTEPQEEWLIIHQIAVWTEDALKPTENYPAKKT